MQANQILRPAEAAQYIGISLRHLYNIQATDPDFPAKIILSARCVGYRRDAIDEWLKRKEQRAGGDR